MARLLGLLLITGGMLVAAVIAWVLITYLQEGQLGAGAIALGLVLGATLVLPQLGLGIYLLREFASPEDRT